MKPQLFLRIVVVDPPSGTTFALQQGRSELVAPVKATASSIVFEFPVFVADAASRPPRLTGGFAQGPRAFAPFDRFAQLRQTQRTGPELVAEFAKCRADNLRALAALDLQPADLARRARHPELGVVTLGQHLATWVAHDLTHIAQIARAMAHRYRDAVGPGRAYLRIVRESPGSQ